MIAFEILFLKGEKTKDQVGIVIAVGCSMFLGKNDKEREEIRQVLTKAYSIRNKIVHRIEFHEPIKADREYTLAELVYKVEEYFRNI